MKKQNAIKWVHTKWLIGTEILLVIVVGCYYVSQSAADVLFMDFWRNAVTLISAVMTKNFTPNLLWNGAFGQRNFLQMSLVAFDIQFLSLNCIWEVYAGIFVMGATAILVYLEWDKFVKSTPNNPIGIKTQFLFFAVLLAIFNLNQWEILSLQFSFAFMLRIFSFLLVFKLLSRLLIEAKWKINSFLGLGIFSGILICTLSQLYFPALLLSIIICFIFALFKVPGEIIKKIKAYMAFFIPCIVAMVIYFYNLPISSAGKGGFWAAVKGGQFFLGVLYMIAASVVPQSTLQNWNTWYISLLGAILAFVVIGAVILYFRFKLYQKSFFPMLVAAYGLLNVPIIEYARLESSNLMYLTSSRYVCETTLIWVGCTMIYGYSCLHISKSFWKRFSIVAILIISFLILNANYTELGIAPARGTYKTNLIQLLKEEKMENLSDEQLALFQAPPELVREGIVLLKRYQLNVYST
ncbi:MAG: hypothetical protein PHG73_02040 [Pygmaiobacter sp.]|nr:hypothetical protein [Pygmaiobacter sp.]